MDGRRVAGALDRLRLVVHDRTCPTTTTPQMRCVGVGVRVTIKLALGAIIILLTLQTVLSPKIITAATVAVFASASPTAGQEVGAIAACTSPFDEIRLACTETGLKIAATVSGTWRLVAGALYATVFSTIYPSARARGNWYPVDILRRADAVARAYRVTGTLDTTVVASPTILASAPSRGPVQLTGPVARAYRVTGAGLGALVGKRIKIVVNAATTAVNAGPVTRADIAFAVVFAQNTTNLMVAA